MRTGELVGTVVGPIALAPVFGAAGRGFRAAFRRIKDGPSANAAGRNRLTPGDTEPGSAARLIDDADKEGLPAPPVARRTAESNPPTVRLKETFADYEGGHRQWVRDLAAGNVRAVQKLREQGIEPDDPAIVRMVDRLTRESDQRSSTPTDYNFKLLDTFSQFRAGEKIDSDQTALLIENGLVKPKVARGVAVEDATEVAVSNVGRRLQEALDSPKEVRNAKLLRGVNRDGAGAVRRELEARAKRGDGDLPEFTPRVIDDGFSDREVIAALEAARRPAGDIDRAGPDRVPPRRRDTPTEDGAPARSEGPEVQALVQWASRQGIDTTEMNAAIKDAAQRAIACGR